jgi:glycosyltransferase involved in cell wall biosynthesis
MAAGLAVVCTDVGGAREAVKDGFNGFVVEPGDYCAMAECIIKMIEMDLFTDMGQRGREKAVKLFSHEEIVARYQRLYEEIL